MRRPLSLCLVTRVCTAALSLVVLTTLFSPEAALATGPDDPGPMRVLVLDFTATGVDQNTAAMVARIVASELASHEELQVLAADDLRRALALEGEKQEVDCSTDSCLAEIADALGAPLVVFGDLGALDDDVVLTLTLYDAQTASTRHRVSRTMPQARTADGARAAATDIARALTPTTSPWVFVGAGALGIGALAGVVGGSVLAAALWARAQPTSTGSEKELAGTALWPAAGALTVGIVVAAIGAGVMGFTLSE